jgi:hypothetical protein
MVVFMHKKIFAVYSVSFMNTDERATHRNRNPFLRFFCNVQKEKRILAQEHLLIETTMTYSRLAA